MLQSPIGSFYSQLALTAHEALGDLIPWEDVEGPRYVRECCSDAALVIVGYSEKLPGFAKLKQYLAAQHRPCRRVSSRTANGDARCLRCSRNRVVETAPESWLRVYTRL